MLLLSNVIIFLIVLCFLFSPLHLYAKFIFSLVDFEYTLNGGFQFIYFIFSISVLSIILAYSYLQYFQLQNSTLILLTL